MDLHRLARLCSPGAPTTSAHRLGELDPGRGAVAESVVDGLTNREIGRRLFIWPNAVNTHLRHTFQKLGVPTRAALATEVHRANPG